MEKNERTSLGTRIAGWIQKQRKILLITGVVFLAILVGIGIVHAVNSAKSDKANVILTDFENNYYEWSSAKDDEKAKKAEALTEQFSQIEKDFSGTWAYQRGLFLMGDFYFNTKEWDKAVASYRKLVDNYRKSYLAPISLYNAAAAQEESGKSDDAKKLYAEIGVSYPDSPLAARALFAQARLTEQSSSSEAVTLYNKLVEQYPQSSWTKLARTRIIELKISQ